MNPTPDRAVHITGLRDLDHPDRWLVPPWPQNANYCDVVRHFLRRQPVDTANARIMLAYYRCYHAALEQAPRHELSCPTDCRWFEEMSSCITWCISLYESMLNEHRQ